VRLSRFQPLENAKVVLAYITKVKKIRLVGIQPEHIVGQNAKMTLGLIWSCINKFMLDKISEEEANARDGLLAWCRRNTAGLAGVDIRDFKKSWSNGVARCALLNRFRPDLLKLMSAAIGSVFLMCR
jgi:actinin alpha